jgi:4-hydroxybenzoate polyprenyltransferase
LVTPREALALSVASGLAFSAVAATLGFWPMVLAPPVLVVLLGYSLAKRVTWAAHAWLGLALALAPGGAWLGMGARPNLGIVALMLGVLTWLLGFDVLYALQDEAFDKKEGLFSIPARFGGSLARRIAAAAHLITVACLAATGLLLHRGIVYAVGVVAVAVVLVIEHRLVRGDLSKIQKAFFDCNAYVSLGFFATTLIDAAVH